MPYLWRFPARGVDVGCFPVAFQDGALAVGGRSKLPKSQIIPTQSQQASHSTSKGRGAGRLLKMLHVDMLQEKWQRLS